MTRKHRKQCYIQTEVEDFTDEEKPLKGKPKRGDGFLHGCYTEVWPLDQELNVAGKKCMQLTVENEILVEKVGQYEDELTHLKQIFREHVSRSVQLAASEIGNHNIQVVYNFDPSVLKEILDQYEDKIKEDTQSLEDQIHALCSRIAELTDSHKGSEQMPDCVGVTNHLRELHILAAPDYACPVSSIVKMSRQARDLVKTFASEIIRLQDSFRSLSTYIDDTRLETLLPLPSLHRSCSTVSLEGKRLTRSGGRHPCNRIFNSELNLNVHI